LRHLTRATIIAAVVAISLGGQAYAFHDGGVADCAGCHSMHSAEGATYLLTATDASSTCLSCHEEAGLASPSSYHISTAAADLVNDTDVVVQRTPGGDFGWLRQDLSAPASYGGGYVIINNYGYTRGHNIVAADNGYSSDPVNTSAPGGTMTSSNLGCESCHDPHGTARIDSAGAVVLPVVGTTFPPIVDSGSYGTIPAAGEAVGVYRLLGYDGYQATGVPAAFDGVPAAIVPSSYNRDEVGTPTRVSYGYGTTGGFESWGNWCGTCHTGMHTDTPGAPGGQVHPVDDTLGSEASNYNAYVKTGDLTGGATTSFTSLVPFSTPSTDIAALAALATTTGTPADGPSGGDRLNCLTCHRAHASGWEYALRWNNEAEFLTLGPPAAPIYPGVELSGSIGNQGQFNRGYTSAQMEAAYQGRPAAQEFAGHQRSLCNKCHLKD
jgi:predicted CXXCH cytochrome family protein